MSTEKILTNGAKLLKEGTNKKGSWRLYALMDKYDEVWGTWFNDKSMLDQINGAAGGEVEVEYEQDGDFRRIKSIVGGPSSNGGDQSATAQAVEQAVAESPATLAGRGSLPETAWLCAAQMAKSDLGWDAAKHLADRILTDLMIKHGVDPTDYPF